MRVPIRTLLITILFGMTGACSPSGPGASATAPPATASTADEATIRAAADAWTRAYNAGDVETIVALYADDAIVMPPHVHALPGREAIRKYIATDIAASKSAGLTTKDGPSAVGISGDLAWHTGTSAVIDAGGKTIETIQYTEVWRRINGKWLMVRDTWNDDAPAAGAPQT